MITQETAARIWNAHREIQTGIKLLEDVAQERERQIHLRDERAPIIRDAFGHRRHFELGVREWNEFPEDHHATIPQAPTHL